MLIPAFFRLNNNLEEEDESKMAKLVDEKELFKGNLSHGRIWEILENTDTEEGKKKKKQVNLKYPSK